MSGGRAGRWAVVVAVPALFLVASGVVVRHRVVTTEPGDDIFAATIDLTYGEHAGEQIVILEVHTDGPLVPVEVARHEDVPDESTVVVPHPACGVGTEITVPADLGLDSLITPGYGLPAIRTSWSDESAWTSFREVLAVTADEYENCATVRWHPGRQFDGWSVDDILAAVPAGEYTAPVLVFDAESAGGEELTMMAVETGGPERGRSFRIRVDQLPSFEVNLSLANMDFFEFADNADPDGVFRGFAG